MKRNFYEYIPNHYIDLSLVAYVHVNMHNRDYHDVEVLDKNCDKLWREVFDTPGEATTYAKILIMLMEQHGNEN